MGSGLAPELLGDAERAALEDFLAWLRERFGGRIRELALFGSCARGERQEESDVDVQVVIDGLTSSERREVAQQAGDGLTHWDVLLSPLAMSTEHWEELRSRELAIAREIEREGIPL